MLILSDALKRRYPEFFNTPAEISQFLVCRNNRLSVRTLSDASVKVCNKIALAE